MHYHSTVPVENAQNMEHDYEFEAIGKSYPK